MKMIVAFVLIAAAAFAASTLNMKLQVTTNSAYACGSGDGGCE